jgi:hypothetical protein
LNLSARHLLREAHRRFLRQVGRARASRMDDYLCTLYPAQRAIVDCWEPFVAVLGTRRAGKSKMLPGKLLKAGERWPGTVAYYIHPDGGNRARETLLGPDINLEAVIAEYGLPWRCNHNTGTVRHQDTGTEIRLRGADDLRQAKKYRGDKVSLVVTEETQNFPASIFKPLVDDILGPALADVAGQWMSIGTVAEVCDGLWYEITRNDNAASRAQRLPGWHVFDWSALDNPHMSRQAAEVIARRLLCFTDKTHQQLVALLQTPEGRTVVEAIAAADPSTLREWFGLWVNESSALFYGFDARLNVYNGTLPHGHVWWYVMGGDLGTGDAYAHHVWAVSRTHPVAYEVESYEEAGLHAGQWREKYEEARKKWNPLECVVDEGGLGKGVCDEWREVYGMPVTPAEKRHKAAAVSTLNAELREGRVKLLPHPHAGRPAGATARTMASLRKDPRAKPGKPPGEDPTQPNHASDAALYGHRSAMRLLGRTDKPADEGPKPGTPEWHEARTRAAELELEREVEARLRAEREDAW